MLFRLFRTAYHSSRKQLKTQILENDKINRKGETSNSGNVLVELAGKPLDVFQCINNLRLGFVGMANFLL